MEKQPNTAPEVECEHRFTAIETVLTNDLPHIHGELKSFRGSLDRLFYTLLGIGGAIVLGLLLHHLLGV